MFLCIYFLQREPARGGRLGGGAEGCSTAEVVDCAGAAWGGMGQGTRGQAAGAGPPWQEGPRIGGGVRDSGSGAERELPHEHRYQARPPHSMVITLYVLASAISIVVVYFFASAAPWSFDLCIFDYKDAQ